MPHQEVGVVQLRLSKGVSFHEGEVKGAEGMG